MATHRYKACLFVFIVLTVTVKYVVWLSPSAMRLLTSVYVTVVGAVTSRPDQTHITVCSSYAITENRSAASDLITAPPEKPEVDKSGRYVSICEPNLDHRRTGNQLLSLAAMLHVARLTGRRVAMVWSHPYGWLDRWFRVPVTRVDNITELCPCVTVSETAALTYSPQISLLSNRTDIAGKSILVCGYFQSWKYTVGVESALRYHLRLLPNVSAAIHDYLNQIRPPAWKRQSFSRIGIHARAGDIMRRRHCRFGFTIPQRPYFERAMARFVDERRQRGGGRVQFIVTSDRLAWVKRAFNFTSIAQRLNRTSSSTKDKVVVEVAHSEGHDAGFDLGLLSLCDGVIMSTGSYGWWAAWLANKTTIYYSN